MMWMYYSDDSDSDNFGAETETSVDDCHNCLDIVNQIVCTKKNCQQIALS